MSDKDKCYSATPAETLDQHITDCRIAKNEAEWWAHHEILRLRAKNEKLRSALKPFADMVGPKPYRNEHELECSITMPMSDFRIAQEALKETE